MCCCLFQMSSYFRSKHGTPDGGVCFFKQAEMLDQASTNSFMIAWDTDRKTKCYMIYESPEQYYEHLKENRLKCGYELIAEGAPCLAYCDVEWIGSKDSQHHRACKLLQRIHDICKTKLDLDPEVYVLCGTRETKDQGVFKNSYHFIIANLYAERNQDIAQLFSLETLRTGENDDVLEYQPAGEGPPKGIIDQGVYTKNRVFRLPLNTKRGDNEPLRRINSDPLDAHDNLTAHYQDDDVSAILPCLVTVVDKSKPTMKLLEPFILHPKPLLPAGTKRQSPQASPSISGRHDRRRRTNRTHAASSHQDYPQQKSADDVADVLVAMHPDRVGHEYQSWRDTMFGAIHEVGNRPEVVKMLQEWTRIRECASRRVAEWPRIIAGTFASSEARGNDCAQISIGTLKRNRREFPAVHLTKDASSANPFSNRAMLGDSEHEYFALFLRHVDYQETAWKWLVQFASYVVPKLKDEVYDHIQGKYDSITRENFDSTWDLDASSEIYGSSSEIYGLSFKRYLDELVQEINSWPSSSAQVETGGEATVELSSESQQTDATVSHFRPLKPKTLVRRKNRYTKQEIVARLIKISPRIHSLHNAEVLQKAIRGNLKRHEDMETDVTGLFEQWKKLQGKASDTGVRMEDAARDKESMEDSPQQSIDETMETESLEQSVAMIQIACRWTNLSRGIRTWYSNKKLPLQNVTNLPNLRCFKLF